jgi:hypothetical protein
MPNSDHERDNPVEPFAAKVPEIPEYLVERYAPRSRDPVVVFGGHLLQVVGALTLIYIVFHFIDKYW